MHLLLGVCVVFTFLLLWIVLLGEHLCPSLCLSISFPVFGIYTQEWNCSIMWLCLIYWETTRVFSTVSYHFTFPPEMFLFLNIFIYFSACIFPFLKTLAIFPWCSHVWRGVLLWFWLAFPLWPVVMSISLCLALSSALSLEKCLLKSFAHFKIELSFCCWVVKVP